MHLPPRVGLGMLPVQPGTRSNRQPRRQTQGRQAGQETRPGIPMTVIGHRDATTTLERELPPVTLLTGPPSVGKWTLATHLADHHRIADVDRYLHHRQPLTIGWVRTMLPRAFRAPFQSPFRLIIVDLTAASAPSLNALLKILEEPPATARFLLTASTPTLPTITSRSQVFRLGTLRDDELADVLANHGMHPNTARRVAPLGRGQVGQALRADTATAARATVLTVIRAIATSDHALFDQTCKGFDDTTGWLLTIWLEEAITGQWRWFTDADTYHLHRDQARLRKMLLALSQFPAARTRIGIRAALEPFLTTT